jgi:hypothetical protein
VHKPAGCDAVQLQEQLFSSLLLVLAAQQLGKLKGSIYLLIQQL